MCAAWGIAMRLSETPSRHTLLYDRARPRPRLSDRAGVSLCKCYEIVDTMVEATCLWIWEFTTHIMDLCADDEDPSQLIIRPGWDAPHVRCFPRTFCALPCLLRQVGTVLSSPYDYVVAGLADANTGSQHTTPALAPCFLFDPLKNIFQEFERSGGPGVCTSIHSTRKSGRTWSVIVVGCLTCKSRG